MPEKVENIIIDEEQDPCCDDVDAKNASSKPPMNLLLPRRGITEKTSVDALIYLAVRNYQRSGKREPLRSESQISGLIAEMTNPPRRYVQNYISRRLKEIQERKLLIDNKLYTISKKDGSYQVLNIDEERVAECSERLRNIPVSTEEMFFNNPTGLSSVFAFKVPIGKIEDTRDTLNEMIGYDIFKMMAVEDVLIVMLNTASETFSVSSRLLRSFSKKETRAKSQATARAIKKFGSTWDSAEAQSPKS